MEPVGHSNEDSRTVVVLGLARSGTSVVTGMLKILGVDMGPSVDDNANPRGSHEDLDFAKFHREVFTMTGQGNGYWNPPPRQAILALRPQVEQTVQELISRKSKGKSLWGWKHSRTLLTYELFLPYLVNPHFVLVFRNLLGTALSSVEHTRNYERPVGFTEALEIAQFYQGEMLKFLETYPKIPKLCVGYEDVLADPAKEALKMTRFLGMPLSDQTARPVADFVIPRDRLPVEKKKRRSFWRGKLPSLIRKSLRTTPRG